MLIAIGGITVAPGLAQAEFSYHTLRSLAQVRRAPGMIASHVTEDQGMYFSLTAWESPAQMKRFATSGAHAKAMARMQAMGASGMFHHYHSDAVPTWAEALSRWRSVHGERVSQAG